MVIEIKMPDIGTDTPEVIEIMVKVGDVVVPEQTLLCVEGDKASMDIPSPQEGTIKEIKVSVGDKVETGKLIMLFESSTEAVPEKKGKTQVPAPAIPAQENTKTVSLPDVGSDELEVTEILVKVGDSVTEEQSLITVEGDKASMEVPAPFSGTVKEIQIKTGDKVKTGSMIMIMNTIEKITPAPDQKIQKTADALPEQKPEIPLPSPAHLRTRQQA